LIKNDTTQTEFYSPSEKEKNIIDKIKDKFDFAYTARAKTYSFFGTKHDPSTDTIQSRNLISFINDSEKRFLNFREQTTKVDPGQFRMSMPITRDKAIAVYSQFLAKRLDVEIDTINRRSEKSPERVRVINILREIFERPGMNGIKGGIVKLAQAGLSMLVKGTVILNEGFNQTTETKKEILDYDEETGECEYEDKQCVERELETEIVRLDRFYPGDMWEADIQKQPYIITEDVLDKQEFDRQFGKYKNYKYVIPHGQALREASFYNKEFETKAEMKDGQYYVLRHYDKWNDEYHILANQVLMTPQVSPFPWKHKKYPFAKEIYESLDVDDKFFYGNSLPNKLQDNQDVIDLMWNMILTQMAQSLSPVILTNNLSNLTDEEVSINGIPTYQVTDVQNTKQFQFQGPNASVYNVLDYATKGIESGSLSAQEQGVGGTRTKTATESLQEAERAGEIRRAFEQSLASLLIQKTDLRISNIIQFMLEPQKLEYAGKELTEDIKNAFAEYILSDTKLIDDTQGDILLRVAPEAEQMTKTAEAIDNEEAKMKEQGKNAEIIEFIPKFFENFKYLVRVNPLATRQQSRALDMAMFGQFLDKEMAYFGDMANREALHRRHIELNNEDAEKLMQKAQAGMGMAGEQAGQDNQSLNNQITRGVKQQEPSLRELIGAK